jgi:GTP-binding protein HflX
MTPTVLLGIKSSADSKKPWTALDSMQELAELSRTAGLDVISQFIQSRESPHPGHYVGEGKVEELKAFITEHGVTLVVTDDELTPAQYKNLEAALNVKVIDRTGLILDIFAKNAKTYESQLQVELAQLTYLMPRLTRLWTHLSRLGGGIGTRGPGEKQLEVDKRQIRVRIDAIKQKLEKIKNHREVLRSRRENVPALTGAIVGYTNAGKSTLINTLTAADVLAENKLFATLDPTTKRLQLDSHQEVLLTDTVGFIQKLPHELVSSFRATLEETVNSDFLLHVVDCSHPKCDVFIETAQALLKDIKADTIPQLFVFNKIDAVKNEAFLAVLSKKYQPSVFISSLKKTHIPTLLNAIETLLAHFQQTFSFSIPYSRMDIVNLLNLHSKIVSQEYKDTSIDMTVIMNRVVGEKILKQLYG